jgi:hypothetical protein
VIVNAGSEALPDPSLTLITMPEEVPTFAAVGVPLSKPEAVLKVAHEGWPVMEKVSLAPPGSEALGWNEYTLPTPSLVGGFPEIVGPEDVTVIEKAGSDAEADPSLTLITMPEVVPTFAAPGVPLKSPVILLNVAQDGRPVMENTRGPAPAGSLALG